MNVHLETLENTQRDLVSVRTLSLLIDTPEPTIRDWVYDGKIPYVKLPSGGIRFAPQTIRQWWRRGVVEPVANRLIKV